MKRRILLLLLAAALCLTAAVSGADVVLTFEQVATHKTTSATTKNRAISLFISQPSFKKPATAS